MAEQDKDLFSKMGIEITADKIDIDITQTKDFLNTLQQTFETTAENIQRNPNQNFENNPELGGV